MNEVSFRIFGSNESGRAFSEAERDADRFTRSVDGRLRDARGRFIRAGEESGRGWARGLSVAGLGGLVAGLAKLTASAATALAPVALLGVQIAAVASTAVAAAPVLAPVAMAVADVGSAAVSAAPAVLALGVAMKITKLALTAIFAEGTAARKALEPLTRGLEQATEAGSKAAARGIQPLADALRRVAQPVVTRFMVGIGEAANRVQKDFLKWGASADGLKTMKGILEPISASLKRLAPDISEAGIAFLRMLGRIMGVSTAAGEAGLTGILDKLTDKFNSIDAESVQGGFDKLARTWDQVTAAGRKVAEWIGIVKDAYKTYTTEFIAVADAVSVAAIAFGGPVVAAIAAVGLIIRHFDDLKAAWAGVSEALSGGNGPLGEMMAHFQSAADEVLPHLKDAFNQIKETVLPLLQELADKVTNDLGPAFAEFIDAAAPVVSWLVDVLGPVVAETFANVVRLIMGAVDVIIGIFKVLTGVLTGDWEKAWEGIKQIASGIGKMLGAIIRQAVNVIKGAWNLIIGILKGIMKRAVDGVVSAAKGIGKGVARAVSGAWGAIKSALSTLKNKIVDKFSDAGNWLKGAGGRIVGGLMDGLRAAGSGILSVIRALVPDMFERFIPGLRTGGISHAAGGGPRSNLTLVGEDGPELVKLPYGSAVTNAGATSRMLGEGGGGGGGGTLHLHLNIGGERLAEILIDPLRKSVRTRGGNVQAVLGGAR